MNGKLKSALRPFVGEAFVYTALLLVYFGAVVHLLGAWLYHLFLTERETYALTALMLIIAQGVFLEELTRVLLKLIKPKPPASPARNR